MAGTYIRTFASELETGYLEEIGRELGVGKNSVLKAILKKFVQENLHRKVEDVAEELAPYLTQRALKERQLKMMGF